MRFPEICSPIEYEGATSRVALPVNPRKKKDNKIKIKIIPTTPSTINKLVKLKCLLLNLRFLLKKDFLFFIFSGSFVPRYLVFVSPAESL